MRKIRINRNIFQILKSRCKESFHFRNHSFFFLAFFHHFTGFAPYFCLLPRLSFFATLKKQNAL